MRRRVLPWSGPGRCPSSPRWGSRPAWTGCTSACAASPAATSSGWRPRCCGPPPSCSTTSGPLLEAGIVRQEDARLVVAPPGEAVRLVVADQAQQAQGVRRRLEGVADAIDLLAAEDGPADALPSGTAACRSTARCHRRRPDRHLHRWSAALVAAQPRRPAVAAPRPVAQSRGRSGWPSWWRTRCGRRRAARRGRSTRSAPSRTRRRRCAARARVGEQIRVLPELPTRMLVIGDSHAVLPEPLGYADVPLTVVRQRGVVEAMTQWFDLMWERAAGARARRSHRPAGPAAVPAPAARGRRARRADRPAARASACARCGAGSRT